LDENETLSSISLSSKQIFHTQMQAWRGKILKLIQVK